MEQMLQNLAHQHDIETRFGESRDPILTIEVPYEHLTAEFCRSPGSGFVDFDAGDGAISLLGHVLGHVTSRTAQLQNPFSGANPVQQNPCATVFVGMLPVVRNNTFVATSIAGETLH